MQMDDITCQKWHSQSPCQECQGAVIFLLVKIAEERLKLGRQSVHIHVALSVYSFTILTHGLSTTTGYPSDKHFAPRHLMQLAQIFDRDAGKSYMTSAAIARPKTDVGLL